MSGIHLRAHPTGNSLIPLQIDLTWDIEPYHVLDTSNDFVAGKIQVRLDATGVPAGILTGNKVEASLHLKITPIGTGVEADGSRLTAKAESDSSV